VNPIFARFDVEKNGIIQWSNFRNAVVKILESTATDIQSNFINDSGLDIQKQENIYLLLNNVFLVDYGAPCPFFETLSARIPDYGYIKREVDLMKKLDKYDSDRVDSNSKGWDL
jgi:hypothetical protein